jgi:hypothetical protein
LFDLNIDPEELVNFIDSPEHQAVKAELQAAVAEYLVTHEPQFVANNMDGIFLDKPTCCDSRNVLRLDKSGEAFFCKDMIATDATGSFCGNTSINQHCSKACNTCTCADSSGPIIVQGNVHECVDLSSACSASQKVRDFCPRTCGECSTIIDVPSNDPSVLLTNDPSIVPSAEPSVLPSNVYVHTDAPSTISAQPSSAPSAVMPSATSLPSDQNSSHSPSSVPSDELSASRSLPSSVPTHVSAAPGEIPTHAPTSHCMNDSSYTFILFTNQKVRDCSWITRNKRVLTKRQGKYCSNSQNGRLVGEACCLACNA